MKTYKEKPKMHPLDNFFRSSNIVIVKLTNNQLDLATLSVDTVNRKYQWRNLHGEIINIISWMYIDPQKQNPIINHLFDTIKSPVMIRKMWSSDEVNQWVQQSINNYFHQQRINNILLKEKIIKLFQLKNKHNKFYSSHEVQQWLEKCQNYTYLI